ncbi:restriction endonuclease subunit S [Pectobacterium versatile]|uniref:restriction endonuclease subunit S n=1 Tax=Pectobacterium versatile TaxID=2488639 RepID=UPI0032EAACE3
MESDWTQAKLGDYIDSCLGKMLDKNKNTGEYHPYLGNSNVRWGEFELDDLAKMKFEAHEHTRYGLKKGDLIICEGGEPGRCAIWEDEIPNMKIQKALHRVRTLPGLDSEYLYYWFLFSTRAGHIEPFFTGTTIKHLTGKALKEIPIRIPPLTYQQYSAKLLRGIDKKITLNRQINQTLEHMAQALFKSWFVDFDPVVDNALDEGFFEQDLEFSDELLRRAEARKAVRENADFKPLPEDIRQLFPAAFELCSEPSLGLRGWVPQTWAVTTVGDVFVVKGGSTPSTTNPDFWEGGDIHWTSPKDLSGNNDKILLTTERKITSAGLQKISSGLLPTETVLMSSRAPVGYLALTKIPTAINQGYIAITDTKCLSPEFTLYWLDSNMDIIKSMSGGTTFAEISKKTFRGIQLVIPNIDVVSFFSTIVGSYLSKITKNSEECNTLEDLRDYLLPKLINGEFEVNS